MGVTPGRALLVILCMSSLILLIVMLVQGSVDAVLVTVAAVAVVVGLIAERVESRRRR